MNSPEAVDVVPGADAPAQHQQARYAEPSDSPDLKARVMRFHREHRAGIRGMTTIISVLVIWQVVCDVWMKNSLAIASPTAVYHGYISLARDGQLGKDVVTSLKEFVVGVVLAAAVGITLGLLMGGIRAVREYLEPIVSGLYSTPVIALGPLFILWFGIGINSKIAVVFILAVLPIVINTEAGIRTVDPHLIETAHAFSASRAQIFRKVLLPGSLPLLLTGLRLGIGRGLLGVVAGELFAAQSGLGYLIFVSSQQFNPAGVFVGITALAFAGIVTVALLKRLERRLAPWRADNR